MVGPAGTGKSHRASLVAAAYGISCVIDDGLLIHEGHIVAGSSSKKEATQVAAVKRAIFVDPQHAREVRMALRRLRPPKVLILGTSRHMIERITDALDLPRPEKIIEIGDVATPEEIRRARRIRRLEGKHVIPAPTFEVKKSFSGYLVDPLRLLRRSPGSRDREEVVEKSVVRPTFSSLGRFFIADTVVAAIAERACAEVDGVVAAERARVDVRQDGVAVKLLLTLRYGVVLPTVLRQAQVRVRKAIEDMTALNVLAVDLVARRVVR